MTTEPKWGDSVSSIIKAIKVERELMTFQTGYM